MMKRDVYKRQVLTLTATPIPRTLNMAMSGIRDMSILEEAPGDRLPVQTYVLEYDDVILSDAIKKELHRGGQVFWLHNRVESIDVYKRQVLAGAHVCERHGQLTVFLSDIINGIFDNRSVLSCSEQTDYSDGIISFLP